MKNLSVFLLLLFNIFSFNLALAQKYYPKLNNLWFEKEGVVTSTDYGSFITEVKRISEKIFYKNYQFSVNGNAGFHSLQIIPKKDSIDNIFKSPITVIFDKEFNAKAEGIPITYTENIGDSKLQSHLIIDKGGFYLLIPEKLFRNSASKKNKLMFNITKADINIEKGVTLITLNGSFPEEIKFKRSPTQEVKKIYLEYTKNKIEMKVQYIDKNKKEQNRILFSESFKD